MSDALEYLHTEANKVETLKAGETKENGKFDAAKVDVITWTLEQFPDILTQVAWRAYAGAQKYSENGWMKVENGERRYRAALGRHIMKMVKGEIYDDDPELHKYLPLEVRLTHWDAVAWNALAWGSLALKRLKSDS